MRIGRAVAVGSMAMGAYRMYRQYKGRGDQSQLQQNTGRRRSAQPGQSGFGSLFRQRDRSRTRI